MSISIDLAKYLLSNHNPVSVKTSIVYNYDIVIYITYSGKHVLPNVKCFNQSQQSADTKALANTAFHACVLAAGPQRYLVGSMDTPPI